MVSAYNQKEINARAFPISDELGSRLIFPKNQQELPSHGLPRLKRQAPPKISDERMRVATLNVGTMTGKGRELVDLMKRMKIGMLCVQETRWKGNNARELGEGCKLYYSEANMEGRNGNQEVVEEVNGYSKGASAVNVDVTEIKTSVKRKAEETFEVPSSVVKVCIVNKSQAGLAASPISDAM
ncbi:uncharacterized protein [Palaemon carinicauda]|uniref:uncharacterized protein n=1 Tax=Palaemon carinicauda TaxID=392227 RepID=UPI0035B5B568